MARKKEYSIEDGAAKKRNPQAVTLNEANYKQENGSWKMKTSKHKDQVHYFVPSYKMMMCLQSRLTLD